MLHHLTFPEGSDVETNCETTLVPHHVGTKSVSHNHGHSGVGSHSDIVQLHHIKGRGSVWVRHWHHHRPFGNQKKAGRLGSATGITKGSDQKEAERCGYATGITLTVRD